MESAGGLRCPNCSTVVYPAPGSVPVCPTCGFTDAAPAPPSPSWSPRDRGSQMPSYAPAPHPAPSYPPPGYAPPPYPTGKAPSTQGVAIVALILNIIIWPGLGSLIAGRQVGWAQGFLFLFGIPLSLLFIGIPMLIGAWIWGIVTGVELINEASRAQQYAVPHYG